MDAYYIDQRGPDGQHIATQLVKQLSEPAPYDLSEIDLHHYRGLLPRWQDWAEVLSVCRRVAVAVLADGFAGGTRDMIHRHLDYPKDTQPTQPRAGRHR